MSHHADTATTSAIRSLPFIDVETPDAFLPSREEYLRQAGVIYDSLADAKPSLDVEPGDLASTGSVELLDAVERAISGKRWALALWNYFGTVEDHFTSALGIKVRNFGL